MRNWRVAVSALVVVLFMPISVRAGVVALPQTGITKCLNGSGLEIPCLGTGQDGELREGAAWPAPRFTDNNDGTMLDGLTGLVWPVDASTPTAGSCTGGAKTWQGALDYISCLNSTGYLGRTDWRLPNINELESLLNISYEDSRPWLGSQGFMNVGAGYWSSTTASGFSEWYLSVSSGFPKTTVNPGTNLVWPVRMSSAGISQVWRTGQTTSYSAGDDGALQTGAAWPKPRLNPNDDGTATDRLTGLIWAQDAGTPTVAACTGGALTWSQALNYIACLNTFSYLGRNDWRLPNRKELMSLIDYSRFNPALVSEVTNTYYIFRMSQYGDYWAGSPDTGWTGTGGKAWHLSAGDGLMYPASMSPNGIAVWPVRGVSSMSAGPMISLSPVPYSFGNVHRGSTSAPKEFLLSNTGTADLIISGITVSSPLFSVAPGGTAPCESLTPNLAPGVSCTLIATFSPTSVGYASTTMVITSNDAATPNLRTILSGAGIDTYLLTVSMAGTGSGQVFSNPQGIFCMGSDPNGCSAPFIEGTLVTLTTQTFNASVFAGWSGGGCSGTGPCTVTMNADTPVTATFNAAIIPPTISLSPASVSFGNLLIGSTSMPVQLTLKNSGTSDLIVSGITVTSPQFSVTPGGTAPCASLAPTLAPRGSCTLTATFTATSGGYKSTTMMITSNDPATPTLYATLSGAGGYPLTVSIAGTGTAFIFSDPSGIGCGMDGMNCSAVFPEGAPVTLTPTTGFGTVLASWSGGGCSGTGPCTVTMNAPTQVTATFNAVPTPKISLSPASVSFGAIPAGSTSMPVQLTLSNTGTSDLIVSGITVTSPQFSVTPGGTAPCASLAPTLAPRGSCTLTATFTATSSGYTSATMMITSNDPATPNLYATLYGTGGYLLTVSTTGTGQGIVTSNPPGISCPSIIGGCSSIYPEGALVTLTANAFTGTVFTGWSGGGCSGTGPCTVTMNAPTQVTATFNPGGGPPKISLSPASVSFGNVPVGSTSALAQFTLSNTGTADLIVSMITTTPPLFSVTPGGAAPCASLTPTLAPGASCTLAATFTPMSGGPHVGYLIIASNDPATPTLYATLSGTGAFTLSVLKTGTGTGTVSSSPAGISCGSDCTEPYPAGTTVTLTAAPAAGSVFAGWSGGGCSGTGPCTITMNAPAAVTATFNLVTFNLTVSPSGAGAGVVTSSPAGISCPGDCAEAYVENTAVTLTATPAAGSVFAGWSGGGCSGTGPCTITMNAPAAVTATFNLVTFNLTVSPSGAGAGAVTSSPVGISCPGDCAETYAANTPVTLTAKPDAYSVFTGWIVSGGGTCAGTGPCTVTMNADKSVLAQFARPLIVNSPNGGETLRRGSTYTITWTYAGSSGPSVKIELLKGGVLDKVIAASTSIGSGGSGAYGWSIPKGQTVSSNYQIRITSTSNSSYTDTSDANFSITK